MGGEKRKKKGLAGDLRQPKGNDLNRRKMKALGGRWLKRQKDELTLWESKGKKKSQAGSIFKEGESSGGQLDGNLTK